MSKKTRQMKEVCFSLISYCLDLTRFLHDSSDRVRISNNNKIRQNYHCVMVAHRGFGCTCLCGGALLHPSSNSVKRRVSWLDRKLKATLKVILFDKQTFEIPKQIGDISYLKI